MKIFDVVVAGAGFSGIAAAVRAARLGMKTLLIEKTNFFGGTAVSGMHQHLCGLYSPEGNLLNAGLPSEIESSLLSSGARKIKIGNVWVLEYRTADLLDALNCFIEKEAFEFWMSAQAERAEIYSGKIKTLQIRRENRIETVETSSVIDCSGAVLRLTGAGIQPRERQLAAFAFRIEGVENHASVENLKVAYCLGKAAESGELAPHLRFTVWMPERSVLRIGVLPSADYDLEKVRGDARRVHAILKKSIPEFRNSTAVEMPGSAVERDDIRLRGLYELTKQDVLTGRKCEDGQVKSSWPVEFWSPAKGPRYDYVSGDYYEIPDACLQSKDIPNLFAAGKFLSADQDAQASARMSGTCLATGERAAWLAAAESGFRMNIADVIRRNTAAVSDRLALCESGVTVTYRELFSRVDAAVKHLKSLPLRECMRAGILMKEGIDYIVLNLALLSVRAVVIPVPVESVPDEISRIVKSMKLDCLITGISSDRITVDFFESTMEYQKEFEALNPAFIRFTSGTTGASKGVVLSHEKILARIEAANQELKITQEDTVLWVLSMSWHFVVTILLYLKQGACITLCGHEIPRGIVDGLRVSPPTFLYAAPLHYEVMTRTEAIGPASCGKVRMAVSTSMALPEKTARDFASKFGVELTSAYGIIEAGLPVIGNRTLPGFACKVDADGSVFVKGPGMFDAYFSSWRPRKQVCEEGWFRTGDLGAFDEAGRFVLLGRSQRVINFMGMKVFPEEVERLIAEYPGVERAYVYGEPAPAYGQLPYAKIQLRRGADFDETELRKFCYSKLAKYKVPKNFEIVPKIETTGSGKTQLPQQGEFRD